MGKKETRWAALAGSRQDTKGALTRMMVKEVRSGRTQDGFQRPSSQGPP